MRILNGGWHQLFGFIRGIAKHDPLIACAFVFVVCCIHTLGNMRRLFVQQVCHLNGFVVKFILFVSNIFDAGARDLINAAHIA